jgi:hypothetical protein
MLHFDVKIPASLTLAATDEEDARRKLRDHRYALASTLGDRGPEVSAIALDVDQATIAEHVHQYEFQRYCGARVCSVCEDHKGLARCFCGWAESGGDGRRELEEMGETIDEEA